MRASPLYIKAAVFSKRRALLHAHADAQADPLYRRAGPRQLLFLLRHALPEEVVTSHVLPHYFTE
jgi:hypothetical protein